MVCKVMKFFIDACIVEEQFVSTNTQISVCKICRVLSLLASDDKFTNLKVLLSFPLVSLEIHIP